MAAVYKVVIGDSGSTTTFTLAADNVSWRDIDRSHRVTATVSELASVTREITFVLTIPANTPAAVVTAFAAFMTARVDTKTLPTRFQVQDVATSTPIAHIGDLRDTTDGGVWQELEITGFSMETETPQLVAGATFTLVVKGRRVWDDGSGISELIQEYTEGADADGLTELRLVSTIKLVTGDIRDKASILRLSRPSGWIRLGPSNNALGIEIRYTNYPRTDEGVVTSAVRQLGDGMVAPALSGAVTEIRRVADDQSQGITRNTLRAEITGSSDPLGWVDGRKPADGIGATDHDRANRIASGDWENRTITRVIAGKTSRVRMTWTIEGSGRAVTITPVLGPFMPIIRRGSFSAWKLTEIIETFALGLVALEDAPLPPPVATGSWVHDASLDSHEMPSVLEYGGGTKEHVWRGVLRRTYWYNGTTDPRANSANQSMFVNQYLDQTGTDLRGLTTFWTA